MRRIVPSVSMTPSIPPTASWRRNSNCAGTGRSNGWAKVEARIASHDAQTPPTAPATLASFAMLADDLKMVWNAPSMDAHLKKRIVRTLIQEVVADIDAEAGEIILLVHWAGGIRTRPCIPYPWPISALA